MKIGIIGAGGIGSYLIKALNELMDKNQLGNETEITVFDNDGVEENNILYQDFSIDDVFDNKAVSLATRYKVTGVAEKVESLEKLKEFDLVVCCVDNTATRRMLFSGGFKKDFPDFIDLRSEGKSYAVFTKEGSTKKSLLGTLPEEEVENGSCQLDVDKKVGNIQQGNKIVALIGSQVILDRVRGNKKSLILRQTL